MLNKMEIRKICFSLRHFFSKEKQWFISHSYDDGMHIRQCLDALPAKVRPLIFQPIKVPPTEFVSENLISAIKSSDGLIYLSGGRSDHSFWVSFERDFAKRQGLEIYIFDILNNTITRDRKPAQRLPIFASYARQDVAIVRKITDWMSRERNFDIWIDEKGISAGDDFRVAIENAMDNTASSGGFVLAFITDSFLKSRWVRSELQFTIDNWPSSVMLAWLVDSNVSDYKDNFGTILSSYDKVYSINIRQVPAELNHGRDLMFNQNDVDDLMVRLCWMIYNNTDSQRNI